MTMLIVIVALCNLVSSLLQLFFSSVPDLLKLGLADNRISDNGASALAELVRCTDTLQTLTLSGNEIRDRGGTILVASLTQNTSLQALYLAGVSDRPLLCLVALLWMNVANLC